MYHTIEFGVELVADLEISPRQPRDCLAVYRGARLQAQIKPSVVESEDGPVEVADLFFDDGTTTRRAPNAWFSFVE